jgi:hypothetical protein
MATKDVALFYMHRQLWPGGMATYTAHLFEALRANGMQPRIIQPCKRSGKAVPFGQYGSHMLLEPIRSEECYEIAKNAPSLLVNTCRIARLPDPKMYKRLQALGARIVVHDHTQFDQLPGGSSEKLRPPHLEQPPILIRTAMRRFFNSGVYIPHPYVRQGAPNSTSSRRRNAICTARIATSKRPRLVLQANRLLPKKYRVDMLGAESRITSYSLSKTYKDVYKFDGRKTKYPQNFAAPVRLCANYLFHVDLSWFPADGGGTQYAQLEAIDAGCIPIMHNDWFRDRRTGDTFRPYKHCLTVGTPSDLALTVCLYPANAAQITTDGRIMLANYHDHKKVGSQYKKELLR